MSEVFDALIIGAGPAGLSAAALIGSAGAKTLLVDENPQAGGQYYRVPLPVGAHTSTYMAYLARGQDALVRAATLPNVEMRLGTQLFDLQPGFRAGLHTIGKDISFVQAKTVLVATGAYEHVVPFPGWTLPGVVTLGAMQNLFKTQGMAPGHRIVTAGSGPFLWLVSDQLQRAGANILEISEASAFGKSIGFAIRSWREPLLALQGAGFWARLFSGRARFRFGWQVIAAEGESRVETVTLAPLGPKGIDRSRARRISCDTLCVSHTLVPSTEIVRLLGAAIHFRDGATPGVPVSGPYLETSVKGLFVAGEAAGLGGGPVAEIEGQLAGIGMARHLNLVEPFAGERKAVALRRRALRRRGFVTDMFSTFAPSPTLVDELGDTTLVCRCEEVTAGDIRLASRDGGADTDIVKSRTRAGMGYCQGRMCGPTVQRLVAQDRRGEILPFRSRSPLKPVPVDLLVERSLQDRAGSSD